MSAIKKKQDQSALRVLVLKGGPSLEREVSLVSGEAAIFALRRLGYLVSEYDVSGDVSQLLEVLKTRPDCVFNALHGKFGEDGTIQAVLNALKLPYTHSGLVASAVAMDKPIAIDLFRSAGILCPESYVAPKEEILGQSRIPPPYVIKPLNDGSSVGVQIVPDKEVHAALCLDSWEFGRNAMVEKFIPGQELTVAVMGDEALAVTEINTSRMFYDYDAKYAPGGSDHQIPARIPQSIYEKARAIGLLAHQALGCRGVSRADMRFDGNDVYLLEVNTQPGLTPTSLVPEQASYRGISFDQLIEWMIENSEFDH